MDNRNKQIISYNKNGNVQIESSSFVQGNTYVLPTKSQTKRMLEMAIANGVNNGTIRYVDQSTDIYIGPYKNDDEIGLRVHIRKNRIFGAK